MNLVKPETAPYFQAFRDRRRAEPAWLAEPREAAIGRFAEAGFPTRRNEAWRYTNIRALQGDTFLPVPTAPVRLEESALAPWRFAGPAHRLVLVNGRVAPALSDADLPDGLWAGPLLEALRARPELVEAALSGAQPRPFGDLNLALFEDGHAVLIDPGANIEHPIEIVHWATTKDAGSVHARNLIIAGAGSRASIMETFVGAGPCWSNLVTSVRVGEGARLRHVVLQAQPETSIHVAGTVAELADGARYDNFLMTIGATLSRQDVVVTIAGKKAFCGLGGVYALRGAQEATIATLIDHAAPGSETREVVKGVIEDRAHGVFQGLIRVRREAQKTDAHQLNRNLLLSPRAAVDTKPELEIHADDVKCSHGATVGDLDEGALFYLRTRGLDEAAARRMLVEAFAAEALDLVDDPDIRSHLGRHLDRWLADRKA